MHYASPRKSRYKPFESFVRRKDENPYKGITNVLYLQCIVCKPARQTSTKRLQRKRRYREINFDQSRRKIFTKISQIVCDRHDQQQQWQIKALSRTLAQNQTANSLA